MKNLRFQREIKTLRKFNHSNIVSMYDASLNDDKGEFVVNYTKAKE